MKFYSLMLNMLALYGINPISISAQEISTQEVKTKPILDVKASALDDLKSAILQSIPSKKQALIFSAWSAAGYYALNTFAPKSVNFDHTSGNLESASAARIFKKYPWYNKIFASPFALAIVSMIYSQDFVNKNIFRGNSTLAQYYGILGLLINYLNFAILENSLKTNIFLTLSSYSTIILLKYDEIVKNKQIHKTRDEQA